MQTQPEVPSRFETLYGSAAKPELAGPSDDAAIDAALERADDIGRGYIDLASSFLERDEAPWIGESRLDAADLFAKKHGDPWKSQHQYKVFRPLSDQVLIRPLEVDDQMSSDSRLVIPANADRGRLPNRHGIVVALGCGDSVVPADSTCMAAGNQRRWKLPASPTGRTEFSVKVGDHVLYHPRNWAAVTIDGESLVVVHEDQGIMAVIDPDVVVFAEDSTTKKRGPDWK